MDTNINIDLAPLARELDLPLERVQRTLELLDEGNTVPFITRYRKDLTGALDEEQIRRIQLSAARYRALQERKQTILKTIESQGKLTSELAAAIEQANSAKRLEDLYLPFKPKKQTLATQARQRGLEPLAARILDATTAEGTAEELAASFLAPELGLATVAEVLQGVRHLLAERLSESADLRERLRRVLRQQARLVVARIETPRAAVEPVRTTVQNESAEPDVASAPELAGGETTQVEPTASDSTAEPQVSATVSDQQVSDANDSSAPASSVEPSSNVDSNAAEPSAEVADATPGGATPGDAPLVAATMAEAATTTDDVTPAEPTPAEPTMGAAPGSEAQQSPEATSEGAAPPQDGAAAGAAAPRAAGGASKRKERVQRANKKEKKRQKLEAAFKDYFDFSESLSRIPPHRVLAINRGERARILRVKLDVDPEAIVATATKTALRADHPYGEFLATCLRDALQRLLMPSLEREIRRELTEWAEDHAVEVFVRNLRNLLLQPPVQGRRVLAVDPGFRSGCKLIALDQFGNVLGHDMIHVIGREDRRREVRHKIARLIRQYHVSVVAIGNGTGCREAEQLVADTITDELKDLDVAYVIVNEAGASVYSTSPIGREELPDHDAVLRGAISIGRRLLDPLSELVKINPANIGVGLYQHDVKAKHLRDSLDAVVESAVNYVGVDVNTASPALLRYVSGLNQLTARRLYEYRRDHGPFRSREDLRKVPGLGDATFVQAAGFLKIHGDNPLDATWIHPESYEVAVRLLTKIGADLELLRTAVAPPPREPEPAAPPLAHVAASVIAAPVGEPQTAPADPVGSDGAATADAPAATEAVAETPPSSAAAHAPSAPDAGVAENAPASVPTAEAKSTHSELRTAARTRLAEHASRVPVRELAAELGVGELSLRDILAAITRPGRDPREDLPPPVFRRGIMKLEDLQTGMELTGTVLNVVDFGVFVDIGLSDSGLVHISRLADRYIRDPHEVVGVGDTLKVWVLDVDRERRRVSLTAVPPGTERQRREPRKRGGRNRKPQQAEPAGQHAGGADAPAPTAGQPAAASAAPSTGQSSRGGQPRGGQKQNQNQQNQNQNQNQKQPHQGQPRRQQGQRSRSNQPRSGQPRTWNSRSSAPAKPISKEMEEGTEPLRSFSDLLQFYEKKQRPEDQE